MSNSSPIDFVTNSGILSREYFDNTFRASGLHSNGYTLARKVLSKYSLDKIPEFVTKSIGEELLIPTRIYVQPIMKLIKDRKITVHG